MPLIPVQIRGYYIVTLLNAMIPRHVDEDDDEDDDEDEAGKATDYKCV